MLPKILDIAEKHGLIIDPRTYGKKETLAKCPFCHEDANKNGKYYLSLNTHDQVYKCWFCKDKGGKGGVLDFESKLTGIPYHEIRNKYFGKISKNIHPAERLSPSQLECIGWRPSPKNKTAFKKQKDLVYKEWQRYENHLLSELFAEFIVIMFLENQSNRRKQLLLYLKERCEKTTIYSCYARLIEEYKKESHYRLDWAIDGVKIARISWEICRQQHDFNLSKIILQIPFIHFLYIKEKESQMKMNEKIAR